MVRKYIALLILALFIGLIIFLILPSFHYSTGAKSDIRRIIFLRSIDPNEIESIDVVWMSKNGGIAHLTPEKDKPDIDILLRKLREVKWEDRERECDWSDRIIVEIKEGGRMIVNGGFANSPPFFSPVLRSPDLGQFAMELVKRKGEKIPKQQ